jgi:hypothetical protein
MGAKVSNKFLNIGLQIPGFIVCPKVSQQYASFIAWIVFIEDTSP